MGPDALADWHTDTHFLFAAHNLPNEACHSPSPPFNSSLADCHLMRFMDEQRDKDPPPYPLPPIIIVILITIVGGCIRIKWHLKSQMFGKCNFFFSSNSPNLLFNFIMIIISPPPPIKKQTNKKNSRPYPSRTPEHVPGVQAARAALHPG